MAVFCFTCHFPSPALPGSGSKGMISALIYPEVFGKGTPLSELAQKYNIFIK
jgi:hypothetical protein